MTYAMRYGYRGILRFLAGVFSGFTLVMLACGLLNVLLVKLIPQVEHWLKIFGALYMLYLAAHIIFSKGMDDGEDRKDMNSYLAGLGLQFLNLKVILYGVTVFSLFIVQPVKNLLVVSLFAPLLAGIGFIATSCWAVGGNLFRGLLKRYYRWFNLAMGALLVYTAIASLL